MVVSTYEDYEEFNPEIPFVCCLAAPRKSGKSTLIRNLIKYKFRATFDYIIIVCPTLKYKDDYPVEDDVSPNTQVIKIYENFETRLEQIIREQEHTAQLHHDNPDVFSPVQTLLILDDCIDSGLMGYRTANNITDIQAERGRHYNMSLIASSQFLSAISPSVRRNGELLFVFAPINYADVERILQEYVPRQWRKRFEQAYHEMFRQPFAFLLIDGTAERRMDFRLRLRKGFRDYIFPLHEKLTIEPARKDKRSRVSANLAPEPILPDEDTSTI